MLAKIANISEELAAFRQNLLIIHYFRDYYCTYIASITSRKQINTNIFAIVTVKGFSPSSRLMMRRFHTAVSLRHLVVNIYIVVKRAAMSSCFITYYYL